MNEVDQLEETSAVQAEDGSRKMPRVSRRALLGGAAGAALLGGAGTLGYNWPRTGAPNARTTSSSNATVSKSASSFRTRPDLTPPRMQVTSIASDPKDGYVLLTPSAVPGARGVNVAAALAEGIGQEGAMILDHHGHLIWFQPTNGLATNLQVQTYKDKPVLTYWVGKVDNGVGYGEGVILDTAYRQIKTVKAGNGLQADLHEFVVTPQGTALITAYQSTTADLSSVGGAKKGSILDSVIQEIDLDSGKVVFEWHSIDHVPLTESYSKPAGADFDYFHINSIDLDGTTDRLLVSGRNTWTIYDVDRTNGTVVSRLGGKKSNFTMGAGTRFAWQHHARRLSDGNISIFDDGAAPAVETQSRGIIVAVDESEKTARLIHAYTHPAHLLAQFEGSAQVMANGNMFLGWGGEPYFSEITSDGELVLDGRFPTNGQSYRAFRSTWTGTPADPPVVVTEKDSVGGVAAYVSWNGATEVAQWRVLTGSSPTKLDETAMVPKSGFETSMTVHPKGSYLAIAGLDRAGTQLGISKTIRV